MKNYTKKGFTLLEILLVIAAIGILAAIVIVAINPGRQLAQARNAERLSESNTLLNALSQYLIENKTGFDALSIPATPTEVTDGVAACVDGDATSGAEVNLAVLKTNQLADLPEDPQFDENASEPAGCTGYVVSLAASNRITVAAPKAELSETISVTR